MLTLGLSSLMAHLSEMIGTAVGRVLARYLGHTLIHMENRIMSALDDLKSAIADLASELTDNNAEIETLLTKIANSTAGTSDADVQSAVASIRSLIADNKAEVDKAKAAG